MSGRGRKTKTYAPILILVLAVLTIVLMMVFTGQTKADVCDNIQDEGKQTFCNALAKEDPSFCDALNSTVGSWYRDDCLRTLALKTGNESICEKISYLGNGQEGYIEGRDLCFLALARDKVDESICSKAGAFEMSCYSSIAMVKNDSRLCKDNKEDLLQPELCYAITKSDPSYCEMMEISNESYCKINLSYCEEGVSNYKSLCYLGYLDYHNETTDVSICQKIGNPGLRPLCYYAIATNARNLSVCEYLKDYPEMANWKIDCYISISKDISYCQDSGNPGFCYRKMAVMTENESLCGLTDDPDGCLRSVASSRCDAALCERIVDQNFRDNCYVDIAREYPSA